MSDEASPPRISLSLSRVQLDVLDQLIERGIYPNRQEAIRDCMRRRFEYLGIAPFCELEDLIRMKIHVEAQNQLVKKLRQRLSEVPSKQ